MVKRSSIVVSLLLAGAVFAPARHAAAGDAEPPYGSTAQEQQAVTDAMRTIQTALDKARQACGNPALTIRVDWNAYAAFEDALASDSKRTKPNIYGLAGDLVSEGLRGLEQLCADDDYKVAASQLTSWTATPRYVKGASSSKAQTVELSGTQIAVTFHPAVGTGGGALALVRRVLVAAKPDAPWGKTVEETKAVKAALAEIDKALTAAKAACGNTALAVTVEWKGYAAFERELTGDGKRTRPNLYSMAGGLVSEGLRGLETACGDATYKRAATKLTAWRMTPKYVKGATSSKAQTYRRKRTQMTGTFHPEVSTGGAAELIRGAL